MQTVNLAALQMASGPDVDANLDFVDAHLS